MKKLTANFLFLITLLTAIPTFAFAGSTTANLNNQTALTNSNSAVDSYFNSDHVEAYKTVWYPIYVYAGETIEIDLSGDGYTNLDLWVFGASSTVLSKRVGSTDQEFTRITVKKSGYIRVHVVNRGDDYNDYTISFDIY